MWRTICQGGAGLGNRMFAGINSTTVLCDPRFFFFSEMLFFSRFFFVKGSFLGVFLLFFLDFFCLGNFRIIFFCSFFSYFFVQGSFLGRSFFFFFLSIL